MHPATAIIPNRNYQNIKKRLKDMKFRPFFTLFLAGAAMSAMAQTHIEGEEYYKADQFNNAKELLLRNMNNPGTDKSISDYYLGLIALRDGNKADAANYFQQGVTANPENGFNYVGLGTLELLKGDAKAAEKLFKDAETKEKKSSTIQIAIARAYDSVDPVAYAKEITKRVDTARKKNLKDPEIYLFEGDQIKATKDFGGAAAKYEMATSYDPNASEAYVKYANLFTMVNPQYAIDMLNKLLELNPTSALAQRELANAYYNKQDYANAAAQYEKYVKNPNHFKQDEDRFAFLLFYGGKFQDGYDYATALLKANPSNFTAQRYQFMNAAQIKEMKDQLLPMAEVLYAAHKADPEKNKFAPIDYTLISSELQDAKRYDEAAAILQDALTAMPDMANFYKQLAGVYVYQNDLAKAADAYNEYLSKTEKPGYNDFVQQAIYAYYGGAQNLKTNPEVSQKYFNMAAEYAQKASDMAGNQYKPVKILGDIAKAQASEDNMVTAAVPLYEKAIVLLENSADPSRYVSDAKDMYSYLGNAYINQNNVAKAKEYFNKYLELDPNNEAVRKYVDGLK